MNLKQIRTHLGDAIAALSQLAEKELTDEQLALVGELSTKLEELHESLETNSEGKESDESKLVVKFYFSSNGR